MNESRRSKQRVDINVAVQVEHQSRLQEFYSRNLSSGGIFLEVSANPPPIGSKLQVSFEVPALKKTIQATAEVVHHHQYQTLDDKFRNVSRQGIGLKFVKLTKNDETLIQQYVAGKGLHVRS